MVRVTTALARIPVIKFRKGGLGATSRPSTAATAATGAAAPSAAASAAPSSQMQPASTMSTSSIPDIDLPLRYRRIPLSQEEIDHINGGGIV